MAFHDNLLKGIYPLVSIELWVKKLLQKFILLNKLKDYWPSIVSLIESRWRRFPHYHFEHYSRLNAFGSTENFLENTLFCTLLQHMMWSESKNPSIWYKWIYKQHIKDYWGITFRSWNFGVLFDQLPELHWMQNFNTNSFMYIEIFYCLDRP